MNKRYTFSYCPTIFKGKPYRLSGAVEVYHPFLIQVKELQPNK
jgi:hypothetical protein